MWGLYSRKALRLRGTVDIDLRPNQLPDLSITSTCLFGPCLLAFCTFDTSVRCILFPFGLREPGWLLDHSQLV